MSTSPPLLEQDRPSTTEARPVCPLPTEPTLWQRYSPHHEFPLSVLSTFVLYFFAGLVLLVLGGLALQMWSGTRPMEMGGNVTFAGGGGVLEGDPKSRVNVGPQEEALKLPLEDDPADGIISKTPDLSSTSEQPRSFTQQARTASDQFTKSAKGKGGKGIGGGKGDGDGPDDGDGNGPGPRSKREMRKDRWIVNFSYGGGRDYLKRLAELGAYLAYPEGDKFRLFEDLSARPLGGRIGTRADMQKWNRIFWQDTRPESLHALADALDLSTPPQRFWVFFPRELEQELFAKELAYRDLTEEQIVQRQLETYFTVERAGDKFSVRVTKQERKKQ